MWKKPTLLSAMILLMSLTIVMTPNVHAAFDSTPGFIYAVSTGTLMQVNDVFYNSWTIFPSNNTIAFDLTGQLLGPIVFTVLPFGNGTLTITVLGPQPLLAHGNPSSITYVNGKEVITYTSALNLGNPLILIYGQNTPVEAQKVLFRDDFLYTNPLLESSWTIDQYTSPGQNSGEYTSSGYLVMKATSNILATVHVTNPMFQKSDYSANGTTVKRKMTVALIPFAKTENPVTAFIRVGLTPLLTAGAFPGNVPYGTPFVDINSNCSRSGSTDAIGAAYIDMNNAGGVTITTCSDAGSNRIVLESGLNPSLYTVFTVETYGIFCSTCSDNAYAGTSWIWFRAYQENSVGQVIQSTDKNLNFTSNIAPLFQNSYSFLSLSNSNSGATGQISKVDFVSVQNYGSPVCLVAPAGFLCSRLPPVPNGIIGNNGLVGLIAWLANQIGFGDEQLGALILFFAMFFGAAFVPYYFSRNVPVGAFGAMLTLGFFTYVGFLPIWTLIIVFLGGAAIAAQIVLRMLGGTSMGGFGGSDNGD